MTQSLNFGVQNFNFGVFHLELEEKRLKKFPQEPDTKPWGDFNAKAQEDLLKELKKKYFEFFPKVHPERDEEGNKIKEESKENIAKIKT